MVNTFEPVLDCAVVGVPHEHLGEVPALFVVPRPGRAVETEALLAHCRAQLSAYKSRTSSTSCRKFRAPDRVRSSGTSCARALSGVSSQT